MLAKQIFTERRLVSGRDRNNGLCVRLFPLRLAKKGWAKTDAYQHGR